MKANKSKVQKKDTKKTVKTELEKSLTSKFLEAVKHLGHDAERIAKDIEIAGKFVAKKIAKKLKGKKIAIENSIDGKTLKKGAIEVKKVVEKAVSQGKPVVQSVKVVAIATEEKVAKAISKPLKTAVAKTKPVVSKAEEAVKLAAKPTPKPATKPAAKPAAKPAVKATAAPKRKPAAK